VLTVKKVSSFLFGLLTLRNFTAVFVIMVAVILIYTLTATSASPPRWRLPMVSDYYTRVNTSHRSVIIAGFCPGPYGDMFEEIIMPMMEQRGYSVVVKRFDDGFDLNAALIENEIDLNICQHYLSLNEYKLASGHDITAVAEVPTLPMAIFSDIYGSLYDVDDSVLVNIPENTFTRARALHMLEYAGLVRLDPSVNVSRLRVADILYNPKRLRVVTMMDENNILARIRSNDAQLGILTQNTIYSEGLRLDDALYREVLFDDYQNIVAVRTSDLNQRFVLDIIDIVASDAFKNEITRPDGKFSDFLLPRGLLDKGV
jgi:D-methionine transport system substrate-binding protein